MTKEQPQRRFDLLIPADIWLREELTWQDKCLCGLIFTVYGRKPKRLGEGEKLYLARLMNMTRLELLHGLGHLIATGDIDIDETEDFDFQQVLDRPDLPGGTEVAR